MPQRGTEGRPPGEVGWLESVEELEAVEVLLLDLPAADSQTNHWHGDECGLMRQEADGALHLKSTVVVVAGSLARRPLSTVMHAC